MGNQAHGKTVHLLSPPNEPPNGRAKAKDWRQSAGLRFVLQTGTDGT